MMAQLAEEHRAATQSGKKGFGEICDGEGGGSATLHRGRGAASSGMGKTKAMNAFIPVLMWGRLNWIKKRDKRIRRKGATGTSRGEKEL